MGVLAIYRCERVLYSLFLVVVFLLNIYKYAQSKMIYLKVKRRLAP